MQAFETVTVEQARIHQLHRTVEFAIRLVHTASQKQRLRNARLALVALDPVFQHRLVLDDACRDVRHDRKAVLVQTPGRRHHVLDRCALDMRDVNARAGRQKSLEIFYLGGGAWHHFNREAVKERPQRTGINGAFATRSFQNVQHDRRLLRARSEIVYNDALKARLFAINS